MNRVVVVFALLLTPSLTLAERSINGEKSATIDCSKDPEVEILSGEGTFTFTGTCATIEVNGGDNKLVIENVKKLSVVGAGNTIEVGGADKIAVTGSGNTITYKGTVTGKGKTKVASIGTGNKIKKK